jgi:signal transduction histidine kinase
MRLFARTLLPSFLGILVFYLCFNVFTRLSLDLPIDSPVDFLGNEIALQTFLLGLAVTTAVVGALVVFQTLSASRRIERIKELLSSKDLANLDARIEISRLDEIGYLIDGFNAASSRIKSQHERTVADYADILKTYSNLSHDLRTPAVSIIGYSELIADGKVSDPAEVREAAKVMLRKALFLEKGINDLLEYTRLKVVRVRLKKEDVDLGELLRQCVIDLWPRIEEAGIECDIGIPEGESFSIKGDRFQLERVILNLLDNAIKYGASGKRIEVSCGRWQDGAELTVRDHGPGISKQDLDKVFERFYRAEQKGPTRMPGYGLGLANVREIVERHSGSLEIGNAEGGGLLAVARLPADGLED